MRSYHIVFPSLLFYQDLSLHQCGKYLTVEQLVSQLPVKRFYVPVLPGAVGSMKSVLTPILASHRLLSHLHNVNTSRALIQPPVPRSKHFLNICKTPPEYLEKYSVAIIIVWGVRCSYSNMRISFYVTAPVFEAL